MLDPPGSAAGPTYPSDSCPACLGVDECRHIPVPSTWTSEDGKFSVIFDAEGRMEVEVHAYPRPKAIPGYV